jgi:hypothetical protein
MSTFAARELVSANAHMQLEYMREVRYSVSSAQTALDGSVVSATTESDFVLSAEARTGLGFVSRWGGPAAAYGIEGY